MKSKLSGSVAYRMQLTGASCVGCRDLPWRCCFADVTS